jgi:hypothetical protein
MPDNYHFDLTAVPTAPAMQIAFANAPGRKATHWKHDKENNRLILAWHEDAGKDFVPFLGEVRAEDACRMIREWVKLLDYGSEPYHDGDNGASFRIYCEAWGHVGGNHYTFAAIEPEWAEYSK